MTPLMFVCTAVGLIAASEVLDLRKQAVQFGEPSGVGKKHSVECVSFDATKLIKRRFVDIEREISRLRSIGKVQDAEKMQEQLQRYKAMYEKPWIEQASTVEPVHTNGHLVAVGAGFGHLSGVTVSGLVTVKISRLPDPIVVILHSEHPVRWKIDRSNGVKISEVFLTRTDSTVIGLTENTTIKYIDYQFFGNRLNSDMLFGGSSHASLCESVRNATKVELVSILSFQHPRTAIELGPDNDAWRAQYVLSSMDKFYKESMQAPVKLLLDSLSKLSYRGAWSSGKAPDEEIRIGKFTPYGPIKNTLHSIGRKGFNFIDVVSGLNSADTNSYFVGVTDSELAPLSIARLNATNGSLTQVSTNTPGWGRQSITYDTVRNRLLMFSAVGSQFYSFDTRRNKWTTLPYDSKNILLDSIAFDQQEDAVYGFGHYLFDSSKAYLFKFKNGRHVKSVQLTESIYEQTGLTDFLRPKLSIVNQYAILNYDKPSKPVAPIDPFSLDMGHGSQDDFKPHCLVFERDTGLLLLSTTTDPH